MLYEVITSYLAKLFIAEDDIVKVKNGQQVAIQLNIYPDEVFEGRITKIWPAFDETEQSYVVEAQFTQMPKEIFSGTQLQANIKLEVHQNVMVIPIKALIKGKYVKLESGEEIEVQTGYKNDEWIEIKSGLKDRITSYNVCYTKLLRLASSAERLEEIKRLVGMAGSFGVPMEFRITSYNVCYTKLLRLEAR